MVSGERCVMMHLTLAMLMLLAVSWDLPDIQLLAMC